MKDPVFFALVLIARRIRNENKSIKRRDLSGLLLTLPSFRDLTSDELDEVLEEVYS